MNPLLDFTDLPRFGEIKPEHIAPAIDRLIAEGRATIERLAAQDAAPAWENFVEPLDDANERLGRAWAQVSHLNAVVNSPELREAYNAALPKVTQYFAEQGQDPAGLDREGKVPHRDDVAIPAGKAGNLEHQACPPR